MSELHRQIMDCIGTCIKEWLGKARTPVLTLDRQRKGCRQTQSNSCYLPSHKTQFRQKSRFHRAIPQKNSPKTIPRSNSKEHSKEKFPKEQFPKEQFHRTIPKNNSKEQSQIGPVSLKVAAAPSLDLSQSTLRHVL